MSAPRPANDPERLSALRALDAEEALSDASFDDLTALAAHICGAPLGVITLIEEERQLFRTNLGTVHTTPRDMAFCNYALLQPGLLVVPDALADERFAGNPMVTGEPHIRFYAGAPLTTSEGFPLGTLCVIDHVPRVLTPPQEQALAVLSRHVIMHLELRRAQARRRAAEEALQRSHAELEQRVRARTAELSEAKERLELAIRAANIGSWEWDIVTGEVTQSEEWKKQLGYAADEFPGTGDEWRKRTHPDDLPRIDEEIRRCLAEPGRDYECEVRYRHKDGSWRWVLTRAHLHVDEAGQPMRMLGCHIEITQRREMEERLQASRRQVRDLAAHLQGAKEEEASRIARELHDELGSTLTGMKFDVAWLDRQLARLLSGDQREPLRERLGELDHSLQEMIASVRKVCRDLRPALLDELGLAVALEWQAAEFSARTGVPCPIHRPESLFVAPACATALFRILQELLTNVARHAQAHAVQVEVRQEGGALEMVVRDDGRGLPADAWSRRDCFGLVGIRERSTSVGGTVAFDCPPGGGTCVTVRLPGSGAS